MVSGRESAIIPGIENAFGFILAFVVNSGYTESTKHLGGLSGASAKIYISVVLKLKSHVAPLLLSLYILHNDMDIKSAGIFFIRQLDE